MPVFGRRDETQAAESAPPVFGKRTQAPVFGRSSTPAFGASSKASSRPKGVEDLEGMAREVGAPDIAQESPGLFRRALDILSRPNYAVAGAAQEAIQGHPERALGRAGTEFFSGLGDLHGQKKAFGQVLEEAGVGTGGSFSDLVPFLYSESGQGLPLQRHGAFDPTARGTGGVGLDILTDPTTWVTAGVGKGIQIGGKVLTRKGATLAAEEFAKLAPEIGKTTSVLGKTLGESYPALARQITQDAAKARVQAAIDAGATGLTDPGGIKWMGMRIAPSPVEAIAHSGVAQSVAANLGQTRAGQYALATTRWMRENIADPIGTMFLKGYGIRGLKGAQAVIDDALNKKAFYTHLMAKDIEASPLSKWAGMSAEKRAAAFKPAVDAFQKGGIEAVPAEFRPAMEYLSRSFDQMYGQEVAAGLLQRDQHLPNYFAHYYDNTPEELAKVIVAQRGGMSPAGVVDNLLKMGRNAEERVYDTLLDAAETSTRLHRMDPRIPVLKPIYDPVDVLQRRWEHSIQKRVNREMAASLADRFGPLPFDVNQVYAAAKPAGTLPAKDVTAIKDLLKGGKPSAQVGKLSDAGKQAFLAARFRNIGSREELQNVLKKYDDYREFFPKQVTDPGFLAADGSHFIQFNVGNYTAELPETLAREVAGLSDTTLRNPALRKILQGYDTVNNIWKGSVTWLFPAFHARNAYSNVAQAFVDIGVGAIDPASYKQTAEILFGKGAGTFKTKLGSYSYDEVRDILNRHGIKTSADALAEFTGNKSRLLKPFKWAREVGTAIENESRAQLALNYLRRGMSPEDVGARVKKFQLDYANGLTNFERQWMKRIIPFYSFQRLNLGLQLDNMLKRPGALLAEIKPFRGREDENAQMTSWDAGALKLRLNRDGKTVQMITGIDLPIRNLDLIFRGNLRDTMANAVGMLSPLIKTPIEVAAGKSLFTGRDFDRTTAPIAGRAVERLPKAIQQWMGYKKEFDKAGRPKYSFDGERYYLLAQAGVTSRFLSTSDRLFRQYTESASDGNLKMLLDFVTGLRWQDMDLDEEQAKRVQERTRALERALVRWGEMKEFRRTYKPKEK